VAGHSPYSRKSNRAFWSRSVSSGFTAQDTLDNAIPLININDIVVSAGSCFAANLVPYLEQVGITYLRTELPHKAFADLPENFGYRGFSAAYGNIYTARQFRQLLDRSLGLFRPLEDRWNVGEHVLDPYRPGLRYPARSNVEFDLLTAQHLRATRSAFEQCTLFVFTLGLTEAWVSKQDGAVFPACPGTIAGTFDPERHAFHNFTVEEVREDLKAFVGRLRSINPNARVILTVSPVPLVATAGDEHVLVATTYSKSVLRVAAGEVAGSESNVYYFPAYEIVTGPQAPHDYFEVDRRNVSKAGVDAVMNALLSRCIDSAQLMPPSRNVSDTQAAPSGDSTMELSRLISEAECEEAMADVKQNSAL
jgi:hypothetical protein